MCSYFINRLGRKQNYPQLHCHERFPDDFTAAILITKSLPKEATILSLQLSEFKLPVYRAIQKPGLALQVHRHNRGIALRRVLNQVLKALLILERYSSSIVLYGFNKL